ncbi:hypothetical protein Hypma_006333 [Hypsizygus marmoreus]|uniref:Uncharacterized protein n=1 Tax=Hypsizygus marmoreus TaxID=39966 RepID=A0A369K0X0_HYPMA|nr:hypothetical protein Hypma_006333 [Hypsizygus marmoreus]
MGCIHVGSEKYNHDGMIISGLKYGFGGNPFEVERNEDARERERVELNRRKHAYDQWKEDQQNKPPPTPEQLRIAELIRARKERDEERRRKRKERKLLHRISHRRRRALSRRPSQSAHAGSDAATLEDFAHVPIPAHRNGKRGPRECKRNSSTSPSDDSGSADQPLRESTSLGSSTSMQQYTSGGRLKRKWSYSKLYRLLKKPRSDESQVTGSRSCTPASLLNIPHPRVTFHDAVSVSSLQESNESSTAGDDEDDCISWFTEEPITTPAIAGRSSFQEGEEIKAEISDDDKTWFADQKHPICEKEVENVVMKREERSASPAMKQENEVLMECIWKCEGDHDACGEVGLQDILVGQENDEVNLPTRDACLNERRGRVLPVAANPSSSGIASRGTTSPTLNHEDVPQRTTDRFDIVNETGPVCTPSPTEVAHRSTTVLRGIDEHPPRLPVPLKHGPDHANTSEVRPVSPLVDVETSDDEAFIVLKAKDVLIYVAKIHDLEQERDDARSRVEELSSALSEEQNMRRVTENSLKMLRTLVKDRDLKISELENTLEQQKQEEVGHTRALEDMIQQRDRAIAEKDASEAARAHIETKHAKVKQLLQGLQQSLD